MVPAVPSAAVRSRKPPQRTWQPYRLTAEQVDQLRDLAARIEQTCRFVGVPLDPAAAAAGLTDAGVDARTASKRASQRRTRAAALFAVRELGDDQLERVAAQPGELRRPTPETLAGWAEGLGLPAGVVEVWQRFCPDAIAVRSQQRGTR